MVKSYGVVVVGGGPCDFSVSPSPFGLDFGTLDSDLGLGLTIGHFQEFLFCSTVYFVYPFPRNSSIYKI